MKNLNFETREEQLEKMLNEASLSFKAVKIIRRSDTQQSRGYGFIEVESQLAAENVVKKLQNYMIDDHALKLSLSTKAMTQVEQEKQKAKVLKKRTHAETQESKVDNDDVTSQKLLVKNLAFECTADEIRELFKGYGSLKKVRLPKKANSSNHRGFGFVEFTTKEEAKAAFKQMQDTHLYGRKLVIEYAKLDKGADAE